MQLYFWWPFPSSAIRHFRLPSACPSWAAMVQQEILFPEWLSSEYQVFIYWSFVKTSRNPFFKGKPPACQLMYSRWQMCGLSRGGGVPWSTSMMTTSMMTTSMMTTSGGGVPWSTSMMTTSMMTTSHDEHFRGSHVTYPTMQSCYLCSPCLYSTAPEHYGKVTWYICLYSGAAPEHYRKVRCDPPQSWTDWQTNMSECFTFPYTMYAGGNNSVRKY